MGPAELSIVKLFRLNVAVTEAFEFIVREQAEEVPEQAPDHPAKFALASGTAVSVTGVPWLNMDPAGLTVTVPPAVPLLFTVSVYWLTPCWVMLKVLPPTAMDPVRDEAPLLDDTENEVCPLPVPLAPEVTVIHAAPADAVQAHPARAVTATVPVPPLEPKA